MGPAHANREIVERATFLYDAAYAAREARARISDTPRARVPRGRLECVQAAVIPPPDRKSTRLNSSHRCISYAVFCLKKKNKTKFNKYHRTKNKELQNLAITISQPNTVKKQKKSRSASEKPPIPTSSQSGASYHTAIL